MGPFIKSKNETNKMMLHLFIALIPIIIFAIYKNGYIPYSHDKIDFLTMFYPLFFITVGAVTSFTIETLYFLIMKQKDHIKNSYSIFPGLLLSLILPLNIPIYILVVGVIIASLSKIIFEKIGNKIFNPVLIGYILILIIFANSFTNNNYLNSYEFDMIPEGTPLNNSLLINGIGNYETLVEPYGSLLDFFIGIVPGSIGTTSALLCIIAYLYLSFTKTIKWKIPLVYVGTVFIINYAIGGLLGQGIYYPLFQILSCGLIFGAVFIATDPFTSTVTSIGQILQGIFLGILTILFRFIGIESIALSILIMNLFVPLIDKIGAKSRFNFNKSILIFVIAWILVIIVCFVIAFSKRTFNNTNINHGYMKHENNNYFLK